MGIAVIRRSMLQSARCSIAFLPRIEIGSIFFNYLNQFPNRPGRTRSS